MFRTPIAKAVAAALFLAGPAATLADRFDHSAVLERKPSGNYYVEVTMGAGATGDFLVDTGSGFVVLTEKSFRAVRDLPGTRRLRTINGAMANGKVQQVPLYRVAQLQLGDSCLLQDVEVAVIPGGTRNILGLSVLRRVAPFAMELSPPTLLFSDCLPVEPLTAAATTAPGPASRAASATR